MYAYWYATITFINKFFENFSCALIHLRICIIDGPILDEFRRVVSFLSLGDADMVIRRKVNQTNYVNAISEEDHTNSNSKCSAKFRNGIGFDFDHGNGNGFVVHGQEKMCGSNGAE